MEEEEYFIDTKTFFEKYNRSSSTGLAPQYWFLFSYISNVYELHLNFDE